jgi:hypothetical protein
MREATCWADALRYLGYAVKGANYRTVQRWAKRWDISADHFDPNQGRRRGSRATAPPLDEVLVENSSYARGKLKERLFATGLKQPICEICGLDEFWHGNRMALVLDHINGVSNDHRLENLRIVCPNCAATLDTHCGRNLPRERVCPSCGGTFAPRHLRHRYCSQECWGTVAGQHLRGVPQPTRRKVPRPSHAQLLADLRSLSFLAVGRKYGVSDNSVRKWLRWYEAAGEEGQVA